MHIKATKADLISHLDRARDEARKERVALLAEIAALKTKMATLAPTEQAPEKPVAGPATRFVLVTENNVLVDLRSFDRREEAFAAKEFLNVSAGCDYAYVRALNAA